MKKIAYYLNLINNALVGFSSFDSVQKSYMCKTLITIWYFSVMVPALASETFMYGPFKVNTYGDIPPTTNYHYNKFEDDLMIMQDKVVPQDPEKPNIISNVSTDINHDKVNCEQAQKNLITIQSISDVHLRNTLLELYKKNIEQYCH